MTQTNPRVLLLEDNPILAESITFALATYDLDVVGPFATNELGGCSFEGEGVSVGVLDLELGNETSLPTAARLREAGIPFLFMSGHDMEEKLPEEFQDEICLTKPVTPADLADAIHELRTNAAV